MTMRIAGKSLRYKCKRNTDGSQLPNYKGNRDSLVCRADCVKNENEDLSKFLRLYEARQFFNRMPYKVSVMKSKWPCSDSSPLSCLDMLSLFLDNISYCNLGEITIALNSPMIYL